MFNGDTVFVVAGGRLSSRKVTLVSSSGADVLIRGNIQPGDRVLTTRLSLPGDGVRVNDLSIQAAAPAGGQSPKRGKPSKLGNANGK